MSEKYYKWREINKSGNNLNRHLTPTKQLPEKFLPSRDKSVSHDKKNNISRLRHYASSDMNGINNSRDEDFHGQKFDKKSVLKDSDKPISQRLESLPLGQKKSTQLFETNQQSMIKNSQFRLFKKNVLAQLDRQKQMINRMVKEILLTVEYQFEKILKLHSSSIQNSTSIVTQSNSKTKINSIQNWKTLLPIKISHPENNSTEKEFKKINLSQSKASLATKANLELTSRNNQKQQKSFIQPPFLQFEIGDFSLALDQLKRQMQQMDSILLSKSYSLDQKTIKQPTT